MSEIVKALKAEAKKTDSWKLENLLTYAALEIETQEKQTKKLKMKIEELEKQAAQLSEKVRYAYVMIEKLEGKK